MCKIWRKFVNHLDISKKHSVENYLRLIIIAKSRSKKKIKPDSAQKQKSRLG